MQGHSLAETRSGALFLFPCVVIARALIKTRNIRSRPGNFAWVIASLFFVISPNSHSDPGSHTPVSYIPRRVQIHWRAGTSGEEEPSYCGLSWSPTLASAFKTLPFLSCRGSLFAIKFVYPRGNFFFLIGTVCPSGNLENQLG